MAMLQQTNVTVTFQFATDKESELVTVLLTFIGKVISIHFNAYAYGLWG